MAAVLATLRLMREEDVPHRAAQLGARMLDLLRQAAGSAAPGTVREVRGAGLLIGVEFTHPSHAATFTEALLRAGVIPTSSLGADHVVRFTPPAVLTDADLDWLASAGKTAFAALPSVAGAHPSTA
jgi:putrescine aminotransferase